MIKDPDTTEEHDFEEVEPQKYARMQWQNDDKICFTAGIDRWIASDLVVKAYR